MMILCVLKIIFMCGALKCSRVENGALETKSQHMQGNTTNSSYSFDLVSIYQAVQKFHPKVHLDFGWGL